VFPIGHSVAKSMTFFPGFYKNPKQNGNYYVDIAGLQDTDGHMIEFVNQFINKKVFSLAQEIKIMIFITQKSIEEARGAQIIKLLKKLMCTFK